MPKRRHALVVGILGCIPSPQIGLKNYKKCLEHIIESTTLMCTKLITMEELISSCYHPVHSHLIYTRKYRRKSSQTKRNKIHKMNDIISDSQQPLRRRYAGIQKHAALPTGPYPKRACWTTGWMLHPCCIKSITEPGK